MLFLTISMFHINKMLLSRYIYRLPFSTISWSSSAFQVLNSVQQQIKSNKYFVRDNALQITHHLADLVDKRQYQEVSKFVHYVQLGPIDKWVLWETLSKDITQSLQRVQNMRQSDLQNLLQALLKLRYEPNQKQNPSFIQLIKNVLEANNMNSIIKLSGLVLQSCPTIFQPYRDKLQKQIMSQIKQHSKIKNVQKHFTFIQGIISNFWQPKFISQVIKIMPPASLQPVNDKTNELLRTNHVKAMKFLQASNTSSPTVITKLSSSERTAMSNTQHRIGLMLADLTYIFDQSMSINGIQVDFLFPSVSTIVQFNGVSHYKINSNANQQKQSKSNNKQRFTNLKPTAYEKWRRNMFKERGFNLVELPFYEWQHIDGEKDQKLYLISKIENSILQFYRKKQNKQKQSINI